MKNSAEDSAEHSDTLKLMAAPPPIQDSLVIIDRGGIIYAGERNYDMAPDLDDYDQKNSPEDTPQG